MPLKVLIIPDKFKGTLTAEAAAKVIARGWRRARSEDQLELLPMTDGGDGFGAVISRLLHARRQRTKTEDAAHRPCVADWWWEAKSATAILESARVIGLAMLPPGAFHPFALDTFGLGKLLRAVAAKGAGRCVIGIGGSATNDGGFGLARALGWEFLDRNQNPIRRWTDLHRLAQIEPPEAEPLFDELTVAVDVQNPLLGSRGATRVYGPQKGLRPNELALAERNLRKLAEIAVNRRAKLNPFAGRGIRRNIHTVEGAGAAGGLGFGLLAFAGARLESGFDLFARVSRLDARLRSADLVITGEGCLDASSLMGKGVGEIARRCRKLELPCIALVGTVRERARAARAFAQLGALTDLASFENAQSNAAGLLERLTERSVQHVPAVGIRQQIQAHKGIQH